MISLVSYAYNYKHGQMIQVWYIVTFRKENEPILLENNIATIMRKWVCKLCYFLNN